LADFKLMESQVIRYIVLIEKQYFSSDSNLINKTFNKYDELGNIVESNVFGFDNNYSISDSSLIYNYMFLYDNQFNQIERTVYDSNNRILRKLINKFDDKGNIIESNDYNSDGILFSKSNFERDKNGNYIEINEDNSTFSNNILSFKYIHKFDSKGNIIEKTVKYYGHPKITTKYNYNSSVLIDEKSFLINIFNGNKIYQDKSIYEYKFDHYGNWIQKHIYKNEIKTGYIERMIEYY